MIIKETFPSDRVASLACHPTNTRSQSAIQSCFLPIYLSSLPELSSPDLQHPLALSPGIATAVVALTNIVDLPRIGVCRLQQLIDLLIGHLLAQVSQDISQLSNADETRQVFVKDLEAAAVFLRLAWVSEASRAVEDLGERLEVNCRIVMSASSSLPPTCHPYSSVFHAPSS